MSDILDSLSPYYKYINENEVEKLDELHDVFKRDFFTDHLIIKGTKVKVKIHPYISKTDNLPEHFCHYGEIH